MLLTPLLFAVVVAIPPQQETSAIQQVCGTVIEVACVGAAPKLMMLLVQPGISVEILARSPSDAGTIRLQQPLSREQRVCVTGLLQQRQSIVKPASLTIAEASEIVPQGGEPGDWPTADVYTDCDPGIQPVTVIKFPRPMYTPEAMKAHIQGAAMVQAIVGPNGQVERARLVKSLDPVNGLDEEALKAAKQWTFHPATKDGVAVRMLVMLEMTFSLRK